MHKQLNKASNQQRNEQSKIVTDMLKTANELALDFRTTMNADTFNSRCCLTRNKLRSHYERFGHKAVKNETMKDFDFVPGKK